jgi:hypothetical protein
MREVIKSDQSACARRVLASGQAAKLEFLFFKDGQIELISRQ